MNRMKINGLLLGVAIAATLICSVNSQEVDEAHLRIANCMQKMGWTRDKLEKDLQAGDFKTHTCLQACFMEEHQMMTNGHMTLNRYFERMNEELKRQQNHMQKCATEVESNNDKCAKAVLMLQCLDTGRNM